MKITSMHLNNRKEKAKRKNVDILLNDTPFSQTKS